MKLKSATQRAIFECLSDLVILFYMYECLTCIYICVPHAVLLPPTTRLGMRVGFPGSGVVDGCKPFCGYWKFNLFFYKNNKLTGESTNN